MLIPSPRISDRDQQIWDHLEGTYDRMLADALPLDRMESDAVQTVREFWARNPGVGYASTSWGKDSTVVSHLVALTGLPIPLVWVRVDRWENPDCDHVRDAFLDMHPHMRDQYHEITVPASAARWWDPEAESQKTGQRTMTGGFNQAAKDHGARHISGIRGEESRMRRMVQARWGDMSEGACRPIGEWTAIDVFAYLYSRGLPVHPAYAMSNGGAKDRRWLRVASLGGRRGADRGRAEWEAHYYPDVVNVGIEEARA